MKVSKQEFLLLNLPGIELFIEHVDELVAFNKGSTFEQCARFLHQRIKDYAVASQRFNAMPVAAPLPAPLTLKMGDLLRSRFKHRLSAHQRNIVYIIREGESVLYVGSTRYGARSRIKSHQKAHSPLGEALRTNPKFKEWDVEMIAHSDYRSAADKEKHLIRELNPAFCRRVL